MAIVNGNPESALCVNPTLCAGPHWVDGCGHEEGAYVGSAEYYEMGSGAGTIDVYVWQTRGRQHICLRHGPRPEDYFSVGKTGDLLVAVARHGEKVPGYAAGLGVLLSAGAFAWTRTE